MPQWLKRILRPDILIPVLMIGGLGFLFLIGKPSTILGSIARFNPIDLIWAFLLTLIYEALRFTQWWFLLRQVGVRVPLKAQLFAFSGREPLRYFPVGDYFENYLLTTSEGVDFGLTSAVTAMTTLFEVAVCLSGLVVLGLGNWWQIRPGIVGTVSAFVVLVWVVYKFQLHGTLDPPQWVQRHQRVARVWDFVAKELRQFWKGAKRMLNWRTLAIGFALAAVYVVAAALILYVALYGIGWHQSAFHTVVAVYFFNLAVTLIIPMPTDFGISELTGVGAFLLVGVDKNAAISAVLLNRAFSLLFPIVIALVTMIFVRDELKRALQNRGTKEESQKKGNADQQQEQVGGSEGENTDEGEDEDADEDSVRHRPGDGRHPARRRIIWRHVASSGAPRLSRRFIIRPSDRDDPSAGDGARERTTSSR